MSRLPGFLVPQAWAEHVAAPYHLRMDIDNLYLCYGSEEVVAVFPTREYREKFRAITAVAPGMTQDKCLRLVLNKAVARHARKRRQGKKEFVKMLEGGVV